MAKFKIEVDLDWLDEEMSIDDAIKQEVISSIKTKITSDATAEITKALSGVVEEKTAEVVDDFLGKTLQAKIENMMIPYKKSSWGSEYELIPMSEFVGMRYENYLNKKVFDENGCEPRYSNDAKFSINEYFIKKYLEKELTSKVSKLIQTARKNAEETIIKTLEQNLRDQLSVDMIQRLNIPSMLKNLQEKAALLESNEQ
ncbi:MAG: hypothetical protein AB2421_20870 [Thermotaleaceae bacterium]